METTENQLKNNDNNGVTCRCGRGFTHCRVCGSRNVYVKRFRSLEEGISVYGCRRCSAETSERTICAAAARTFKSDYQPLQRQLELPPWGILVPGSNGYGKAMVEAAVEYSNKKNVSLIKAYLELKKQGWQLELYELDESVNEALFGLAEKKDIKEPAIAEQPSSTTTSEAVSLDEIIKSMQGGSK
jgi:hypothetical protein